MRLMIIWGSSREGRNGGPVTDWVKRHAAEDSRFEVDFVDLRELSLPFFDESISPFDMARAGRDYIHPEGKAWAQRVSQIDGLIIVTPEYNHGPPAILKNTLDWVGPEWVDKPVGIVSYGGASGGTFAVEQLRLITIELGLVQVANAIFFTYFKQAFSETGEPKYEGTNEKLKKMFDEVIRLSELFKKAST